ncbi:MAG: peptidoglycan DD-metalloendopeptidase family protein [Candidatus Peribacteria bacterium]|nr:MAG: peptidoglycan DD-metalloendopeptidase family protein [Candidatus Peribacteria bacterium]
MYPWYMHLYGMSPQDKQLLVVRQGKEREDAYIDYGFGYLFAGSDKERTTVRSDFGPRFHPVEKRADSHPGFDLDVEKGRPILCPYDGEIILSFFSPTAGNCIVIKHLIPETGKIVYTVYMHLQKRFKGK